MKGQEIQFIQYISGPTKRFVMVHYGILYIWMLPIKNEEQKVTEEDQLIEAQV